MLTSVILIMTLAHPLLLDKDAPADKVELFAREKWYQTQSGKEQEFVGVLRMVKGDGGIGFGRFNPYRLEMKKDTREVYIGGKPKLLAAYVGKRVKLTGKAVDMEVEGREHREIWPARLVVLNDKEKGKEEVNEEKVVEEKPADEKGPKIEARAFWRASSRPGAAAQQLVIRSAAELAKAMNLPADGKGQELATTTLARLFKVDTINWDKQMVIVASGGAKPTGGYSVEVTKLAVKDKTMTVHWKLNSPKPGSFVTQAFTHPAQAVLTERFGGEVRFDPPAPKKRGEDK